MCFCRAWFLPKVFYLFVGKGLFRKRALIVGAGMHAMQVCRYLQVSPHSYFDIVGFCDDDPEKAGLTVLGRPVLGTSRDIPDLAGRYGIREAIIAISNIGRGALLGLIDRCKEAGLVTHVISDLFLNVCEKLEAEEFGGLITYRVVPETMGVVREALKRLVDVGGSFLLLLLLSPVFAAIAL
jgi:FlaA1/EpsC-like NDP-sugar epimerase